jgi:hypothetical protein
MVVDVDVDVQYRLTQLMANPKAVSFRPVMSRRAIASRTNIAVLSLSCLPEGGFTISQIECRGEPSWCWVEVALRNQTVPTAVLVFTTDHEYVSRRNPG